MNCKVIHTSIIAYSASWNNGPTIVATCEDGSIWVSPVDYTTAYVNSPEWTCIYSVPVVP